MSSLLPGIFTLPEEFSFLGLATLALDTYLVWLILYYILKLIKVNVRAIQILKGLIFVYLLNFISTWLNLHTLNSIIDLVIEWGILGIIIIFQPEIRAGLEQIGRNSLISRGQHSEKEDGNISILTQSIEFLAKRRIGALIVLEQDVKLDEFVTPSTIMDSQLSKELLTTVFIPTTPLHDGAVIIRGGKLHCAGAYLPSTHREDISKDLGTRHRAAIGISEISDSVTLTVSEETGRFSIAHNGQLKMYADLELFRADLEQRLGGQKI
ncbi:MAG: diadenylate cyclase CdaA [Turicibacter sp.]|nr:diadenylate cyclase CdaA [Turicibacter sp.]